MSTIAARRTFETHPAAKLFPMLSESELQELAEDIHRNGLIEPIALFEEQILDGRNRMAACELAGVEPRFVRLNVSLVPSPTVYVISKNLHRRHLTIGQRAAIATESLPMLHEEAKKRLATSTGGANPRPMSNWTEAEKGSARMIAAKAAQVSETSLQRAIAIQQHSPEDFERMKRGEIGTYAASEKAMRNRRSISEGKQQRIGQVRALAIEGYSASQIAVEIGVGEERVKIYAKENSIRLPADEVTSGITRNIDVNRVINETVLGAHALIAGLELIEGREGKINQGRAKEWADSLYESMSVLNRLLRQLRRITA